MDLFSIVVNQVGFFATALLVGFAAQRVGFMKNETIDSLSRIMMKVVIPIMVITVVASSGTKSDFIASWPFIVCCIIMYGINFLVGLISGKGIGLKKPELNAHICSCLFQNSAMLGYPIIMAMFPETSGIYIAGFLVAETVFVWTVGVLILSSGVGEGKIDLKKMVTPMTVALVIALLMIAFDIHPDNVAWDALTEIGGIQKYLGLLYLGSDIGRKGFKKLFGKPKVFLTIPLKNIVCPFLLFFILKTTGFVDTDTMVAITVFAMLPSMMIITILAQEYKCAPDYGTGAILATTTASLATMPFVFYIVSKFI